MGRIIRIEVKDFKSYRGLQTIGPFKPFTAIIGPNGGGKSNMMDAISFVVGVQTKHLRGEQLRDLVYNADGMRDKTRRDGFVKLIYEPAAGELAGVEAGDELEFGRMINSNGSCRYTLQGRTVTREAYDARLKDIGVLVRARNFLVFQGDVESIASKTPKQLTQFFEDISGSGALSTEYDDLLAKKEKAEIDTIFTFRQKKGITQERKQARVQKEEAERFNAKLQELNEQKTKYFLMQLWQNEQGIKLHENRIKNLESELAELSHQETVVESHIEEKRREAAQALRATSDAERSVRRARTSLAKTEPLSIKAQETVTHLKRTLEADKQSVAKAETDLKEQSSERETLARDLDRLNQAEAALQKQLEEAEGAASLSPANMRRLQEIKEQARAENVALRAEHATIRRGFDVRAERLAESERTIQNLQEQKAQLMQEEEGLRERLERMTHAITSHEDQVQSSRQSLHNKQQELKMLREQREEHIRELDKASAILNQAKAYSQESQKERKMTEFLKALQSHFPGVKGRLVDLCSPSNRKYDLAIQVALGRHMDAIVVDREDTGLQCIKYMRDRRAGVATFLPLDTIEPKRTQERHRQLGPNFKLAIDLLEYNDDLDKAMQYALAGVVICDTLQDARDLCFRRRERVKAVTIDGHIISTNGDMTGGTGQGSRGHQNRFEQKELDSARTRRNEIRQDLEELEDRIVHIEGPQSDIAVGRNRAGRLSNIGPFGSTASQEPSLQDLQTAISNTQNRLKFARDSLDETKRKIREIAQSKQNIDNELERCIPERDEISQQIAQERIGLERLESQIKNAENEHIDEFGKSIGIANVREEVDRANEAQEVIRSKMARVAEHRLKLQTQHRFIESRKPDQLLERARQKLEQTEARLAQQVAEAAKLAEELNECNRMLDEAEIAYKTQKREADDKALESKEAANSRNEIITQKGQIMKKLTMEENEAEKLRAKRHETLRKAELDQVDIPLKDGLSSQKRTAVEQGGPAAKVMRSTEGSSVSSDPSAISSSDPNSSDPSSLEFSQPDSKYVKRDEYKTGKIDFSMLQNEPLWRNEEDEDEGSDNEDGEQGESSKSSSKVRSARQAAMRTLDESMKKLAEELEKMQPNMKADERFADVTARLKSTDEKLTRAREEARDIELSFENIKQERYEKFMHMFEHVSSTIEKVYRDLTKSDRHPLGGNAYLSLDNTDEPYLGGIKYNAMPPTKRFRDMEQLSGGEKTVAALALLFAIHSYHPAPFFVMDEVDAALDNVNVSKVSGYIQRNSNNFQCLVISLKDTFFDQADALVGVYREVSENCSKTLTLDMTLYPEKI